VSSRSNPHVHTQQPHVNGITDNGYDQCWVEAINGVLKERDATVRIVDLDDAFWERFIGPLVDAIDDCDNDEHAHWAYLTTEWKGMDE
jgi:hypothetical protein